eukprot:scaffold47845_cov14-Prasinocladus_malaysianus.AAC.1
MQSHSNDNIAALYDGKPEYSSLDGHQILAAKSEILLRCGSADSHSQTPQQPCSSTLWQADTSHLFLHGGTKSSFGVEQYTPPESLLLSVTDTLTLMSIHQFFVDKVCGERHGSQCVSKAADSAEKATLRMTKLVRI